MLNGVTRMMSTAAVHPLGKLMVLAAFCCTAYSATADILATLERDVQGKITPFLSSRHGSYYMGGQSLAQRTPLTSLWPVIENETLGFLHPYFRDGRARGEAITCDEITGCGHSLYGWDFYRVTRVLNGSVTVEDRTYVNPSPTTVLWRPDRVTARYEIEPGVVLQEVKFFTEDDVLVDIITLLPQENGGATQVDMHFSGQSYVNTRPLPPSSRDRSTMGLPAGTQRSIKRNSTVELDSLFSNCGDSESASGCSAFHVVERGTGYAKPVSCDFDHLPPDMDCLVKEGPMMYDGMSVFIAASTDISQSHTTGKDADLRSTYSFTTTLTASTPLVLGWVMGDDEKQTRGRIAQYMSPAAAQTALDQRSSAANEFLSTKVPQLSVKLMQPGSSVQPVGAPEAISGRPRAVLGAQWDVHQDATCQNNNKAKIAFFNNITTLSSCQAACTNEPTCRQLEFQHSPNQWCGLYNTATMPSGSKTGSKYDCACKNSCPAQPGPKPSPPSPVPPMNRTIGFENGYYFGWAMYWMLLLEGEHQPYETMGHAQSAPSNFLGLHLHDTQYYLKLGSWVSPELHPAWAHGNILLWEQAAKSPMYTNTSNMYWQSRKDRALMPDNMGATWISSSTCDQLSELVEGAWAIYSKDSNVTFLASAYDLFSTVLTGKDGNITGLHNQKLNWAEGKQISALQHLAKMAQELHLVADFAAWAELLDEIAPRFSQNWGKCGQRMGCTEGIGTFSDAIAPEPYFKDEWAQLQADAFLLDDKNGHYPPNASYGAVLLAFPLNGSYSGPWVAHTTYTYEAIDGLFRHNAHDSAIHLATEHIRDMQRTYGWTTFPEAWSAKGGPWGDQWYNWGSCVSTVMVLERLAGVDYSATERAANATTDGILTVRDFLPPDWEHADVKVPLGAGQWVHILVKRVGTKGKQITVSGNPFGALRLQPALGSRHLVSAVPHGGNTEPSGQRVGWEFVDSAAKAASVTVTWA